MIPELVIQSVKHGEHVLEKETRSVFVIIPFTRTPTRNKADFDDLFKVKYLN